MVGMSMSEMTRSGRSARAASRPSAPSFASSIRWPSSPSSETTNLRLLELSSTTSILAIHLPGQAHEKCCTVSDGGVDPDFTAVPRQDAPHLRKSHAYSTEGIGRVHSL